MGSAQYMYTTKPPLRDICRKCRQTNSTSLLGSLFDGRTNKICHLQTSSQTHYIVWPYHDGGWSKAILYIYIYMYTRIYAHECSLCCVTNVWREKRSLTARTLSETVWCWKCGINHRFCARKPLTHNLTTFNREKKKCVCKVLYNKSFSKKDCWTHTLCYASKTTISLYFALL